MSLVCGCDDLQTCRHPWGEMYRQPAQSPLPVAPLAGHAGDCGKVTHATVKGETDWPCTCDCGDRA